MRGEEGGKEVGEGWRSKSICQADLMGWGGGCNVDQGQILDHNIQAYILSVRIQSHLHMICLKRKQIYGDPSWEMTIGNN